jgi:excisionase family DNA binding protein
MEKEELTFDELPSVLALVLRKVEGIEKNVERIQAAVERTTTQHKDGHTPMTLSEACEFLKMKRSTMYYHLENGNIPATRKGKNYILFKDELLKWAESGRINDVPLTFEEQAAAMSSDFKRKANPRY